jgi:flagellar capping protein FliD
MPIDPDVQRELTRLAGQIAGLDTSIRRLSERVAQLEKMSAGPQVARIAEAFNQLGSMWAKLQQNQTRTNQPIEPWRLV